MNPIEKFQAKGRMPWKLGLQVVKIFLVTAQLICFGYDSSSFQLQHRETTIALDHLFLEGWTPIREVPSYPPSTGPYAVYTKRDFYRNVDTVIRRYTNVTKASVASLGYDTPDGSLGNLRFCKTQYKETTNNDSSNDNEFFVENIHDTTCLTVEKLYPKNSLNWQNFSIEKYAHEHGFNLSFERLLEANVHFSLKTIYLNGLSISDFPQCYKFHVNIKYNNEAHDGQLLISLKTKSSKLKCVYDVHFSDNSQIEMAFRQLLNGLVILVCLASLLLCIRSLLRAQLLRERTETFFWNKSRTLLSLSEKLAFVDLWYVMILMNDILIIIGSTFKIQLEQRLIGGEKYNFCSALLGLGNLLVWAGVLRYLGFFRKYNILILTMKRATPNLLRFLLCALLLYMGFCFCGWVVLGPHNIKFRSLSSTSECLFALMNGDDMFATFGIMGESTGVIWWFARIYLYSFLILFIYCVISLFLSVIMDSYETIRESYDRDGTPSHLWIFMGEDDDDDRGRKKPRGIREQQQKSKQKSKEKRSQRRSEQMERQNDELLRRRTGILNQFIRKESSVEDRGYNRIG